MTEKKLDTKTPGLVDGAKLFVPILLFPAVYLPYAMWGRRYFVLLIEQVFLGQTANPMRLLFTGNNTILLFWLMITAAVMVISLVVGILKIRPWYFILLYLAVMFSLCGILSLTFYTFIVR